MYLYKKTYVKNWSHMKPEERHTIKITLGGKPRKEIKPERISEIVEEVAYWRKANAIHQWFVENVQNGNDDCRDYYVENDQLKELLDACKNVLAASVLVKGHIKNGEQSSKETGFKMVPNIVEGEFIKDPSVAIATLPTQSGFFFGSQDYDEYYYEDIKYTAETLEALLEEPDADRASYYYSSSW